jgi:hypothetical protein
MAQFILVPVYRFQEARKKRKKEREERKRDL